MIVMVENEEVTGQLNRHNDSGMATPVNMSAASQRFTSSKLYAEYLRREGRPETGASNNTHPSQRAAKERREVDDQFRDF